MGRGGAEGGALIHRGSSPEDVLDVLKDALPEQRFGRAEILSDGWDNLGALVDGRWIFRFPQRPEYRRDLERNFLAAMDGRSPVAIPKVLHWSDTPAFMAYEALPGVFASKEWFEREDWLQPLAEDLAAFYAELHSRISVEQARAWGAPDAPGNWANLERQREAAQALDKPLRDYALHCLDDPPGPTLQRALHGDVHFGNMLFDPGTRRVSGLFDFGDACVGDPAFELYDLAAKCPPLAAAIAAVYERKTRTVMDLRHARRYAAAFSLTVLATEDLAPMKEMALGRLKTLMELDRRR